MISAPATRNRTQRDVAVICALQCNRNTRVGRNAYAAALARYQRAPRPDAAAAPCERSNSSPSRARSPPFGPHTPARARPCATVARTHRAEICMRVRICAASRGCRLHCVPLCCCSLHGSPLSSVIFDVLRFLLLVWAT
ncbi:hypothetical protein PHLGIDRAFT_271101 [Phlebiopsis gigantea 11061_1 CR5-6]|uniref:Uncharacterized protein n=1 Tax=Phlebiopsis gigantea (strain 11061_1 CR5-6) TaxID=745531 RepID=A0A0C3NE85_PHLG1|nr:hypothetical protein PHLGIDRAFT_271101 [Phlebiopsis gigantea 11061_1 CR5-6]